MEKIDSFSGIQWGPKRIVERCSLKDDPPNVKSDTFDTLFFIQTDSFWLCGLERTLQWII